MSRLRSSLGRRLRTVRDHRRSLRVRLLAALLGTAIAVFAAVDVATLAAIRSFLMQRIDNAVGRASRIAQNRLTDSPPATSVQTSFTPGRYYVGMAEPDATLRPLLLDPLTSANPPHLPAGLTQVSAAPRTASATRGGAPYRIIITSVPGKPGARLVVGISLDEYETTVNRITLYLIAGTVSAFAVLAGAGWALTRRGLRPLERIADRADTVTGGDLSARMDVTEATSEVGRLSTALNSMLDRIEDSVRDRDAAEARIRLFMADASHELRTPLTTVRAYAELYQQGALADAAAVSEAMGRISSEAARMSGLVGQLLTLARLDAQPPPSWSRIDLTALVADAVADARAIEPGRRITMSAAEDSAWVDGDRAQLTTMIGNVLANVRAHAGSAAAVTVTIEHRDGHHVLDVADSGPGAPDDALPRLFDRFYRATPPAPRGSGLGLAIVAAIAEWHGGHVAAGHVQPSGLRISIELPAVTAPATPPAGAPDHVAATAIHAASSARRAGATVH